MTTVARPPALHDAGPDLGDAPALRVRWRAWRPSDARPSRVECAVLRTGPDAAVVRLTARDARGEPEAPAVEAPAVWRDDPDAGLVHVDAPGLLALSAQPGRDGWRVLYARTPLFSAWGFPGGSYEPTPAD